MIMKNSIFRIEAYFGNNDHMFCKGHSLFECLCEAVMHAEAHNTFVSGYYKISF